MAAEANGRPARDVGQDLGHDLGHDLGQYVGEELGQDVGQDLSPALVFGRHVWALALDYRVRMREALHAGGHAELTPPHASIISNLPSTGASVGELAVLAGLSVQRAGQLVQQLVAFGYLERRVDEFDGRARRVEFSARGLELLRAIERLGGEIWQEYERRVGPQRLALLANGVDELHFALAGADETLKLGHDDERSSKDLAGTRGAAEPAESGAHPGRGPRRPAILPNNDH